MKPVRPFDRQRCRALLHVQRLETRDVPAAAFLGAFVPGQSGGLDLPRALRFGPDGDLFVASGNADAVFRYDGTSGAFEGAFVAPGSGGLDNPFDLTFGPDGHLYVSSEDSDSVLRYDGMTGTYIDTFVPAGSGGLGRATGLAFAPDGNLLVSSYETGQVLEFRSPNSGSPGEFLGVFASTGEGSSPDFLIYGPDGHLYVGCPSHLSPPPLDGFIGRYDGTTGTFIDTFVPSGQGGLSDVRGLLFDGEGHLLVADTKQNGVLRYQGPGGVAPGAFIEAVVPTGLGGLEKPIGIAVGSDGNLYVSSRDTDSVLRYGYTKFYVVNDAGTDRTYEYANGGAAVESYALGTGNSAPRGAASTAAGTKVWVVDANKKVYVYGPTGVQLGSWTANGLPSNAQVEGIATNGTDVWIIDNAGDKVYRYAAAASRLSGSQSAASSFSLNSGNSNPKDLVTDGASIWVVNDSTTDKVFKYTLAGSLLGSWTIAAANSQPTGITLDPANVAHLWIVDAAADKVFQYDNAVGRTSGSQSAAATFALAAGNTNPQGIADPPVAPPPGLVSWWTADNTPDDRNGLNHATLVSGATYAAGMVGPAFSFDGVNDRVQVADSASLALTASLTIEGWIRVNALPPSVIGNVFFRGDDRGALDPYFLAVSPSGRLQFVVNPTAGSGVGVETPIPVGQFVHVAATLDNATGAMKLYVNGTLATQTTTTIRPFGNLDPGSNPGIGIGNHGGHPVSPHNFPFNGLIDELAVYNRALTAVEIQAIYGAGSDGKIKGPNYFTPDFPSVVEGGAGTTTTATFTIQRVGDLSGVGVVNFATADGTATAGSDYVAAAGQVTFQPGETQKTVPVTVIGDAVQESNEMFRLVISTAAPGFAVGEGQATIVDIKVSVEDGVAAEGDSRIGQFLGSFVSQASNGGLQRSTALAWGPDGNLYVGSLDNNRVLRYSGTTGAFLDVFLNANLDDDAPFMQGLQFRPDGLLYVLSRQRAGVQRFVAATGGFYDYFIPSRHGGLNEAGGMAVGPDGNWYISSSSHDNVKRYSGATGEYIGVFVAGGSGGVDRPRALTFGPDGHLYVTSEHTHSVLRYDGQTGAFLDAFVPTGSGGLANPAELLFTAGSLYVASQNTNEVLRYDAQTGAFLDKPATAGLGGLDQPIGLLFDPNGDLLVGSHAEVLRYGPRSRAAFTVQLSVPSDTPVTVNYATANGTALAGSDFVAASGTVTFAPGEMTKTIVVRTLDDTLGEGTETFVVNLSNAGGAAITDAQAIGVITDNEPFLPRVGSVTVNGGVEAQRSRVTSIAVTFNDVVTFAGTVADAFTVSRIGGTAIGGFTATAAVVNGVTVVTLSGFTGAETQFGSLADGRYALTVRASQVSAGGQPLDGNGDGTGGDDYTLVGSAANGLFRLYGDANGDGVVNAFDFGPFRGAFGSAVGQAAYLDWLDVDGDGVINAFDFAQFRTRFGSSVP